MSDSESSIVGDAPEEVGKYPPVVYIIRMMHNKSEYFDYVYSSVAKAEHRIKLLFKDGVHHDLEIVKLLSCVVFAFLVGGGRCSGYVCTDSTLYNTLCTQ